MVVEHVVELRLRRRRALTVTTIEMIEFGKLSGTKKATIIVRAATPIPSTTTD
jgi:hypothetical protein